MKTSNKQIANELEIIKASLEKFRDGAGADELRRISGLNLESRTFQRRLNKLQEQGEVYATGIARGIRYILTAPSDKGTEVHPKAAIPLSEAAHTILALVSQPVQRRTPVGYNRAFLEAYRPNVDSYLTETEKHQLTALGKTMKADEAAGTYAKDILNRLLIDLSWNSSRLEGNTYSLLDTERLLALGEIADNHSAAEAQMILNHKDAIEFLIRDPENIGFNRYTVLNLHALLSNNLLGNRAASGRLRVMEVRIGQSVFAPLALPQLIEEMFELLLLKAAAIKDPFEQAFFMMVQLPYLQPFDDVNKRVSRLAANIPFNRLNLSPLSFVDVPNDLYVQGIKGVYELNRIELLRDVFMWAYQRSAARYAAIRQSLGEPDPFMIKYREPIKELVAKIVSDGRSHREASKDIKLSAVNITEQDRLKFIEVVETELMNLHEGNFARYWISPSSFKKWKDGWFTM